MIPIPFSIYVGLAALAIGLGTGYKVTANHYDAKLLKQERAAHEKYIEDAQKLNAVAAQLEEAKSEREIVYRTITKRVDKVVTDPVYRNQCLSPDGLRIIADAVKGSNTSKPDAAMPAAIDP